ncbi:hypothetical protein H2200_007059 [Cladophialophora chaetospira]|uniref:AB hydrolase-1 domain-containing protein n=1 Tax=Cladophialophora chaetospira TaxID=386627 RepID=A0AA38X7J4_9EURO|nr:hypothetical protein H2200_007059 [Cladophialophora chaetospira]
MDKLEGRKITTSRSLSYTYYTSQRTTESKEQRALLFCHGFPDSAFLWNDVLAHLGNIPHKVVVPDMLGYAGTAKPLDKTLYNYAGMADDLREILDAEEVDKAIVVGHDWGAAMVQRFYAFHADRVAGIILLNIAYHPPSKPGDPRFDLQGVNELLQNAYGAPLWTYWEFFTSNDGPQLMRENLEKVYEAQHGDVPDWGFKMFCVPGAWREYVVGSQTVPLKPYAKEKRWRDSFFGQFEKDSFEAPVQWYRAMIENVQYEVEVKIPTERRKIEVPVLFVGCTQDANNRIDLIEIPKEAGLLPQLEVKILDCGHWCPMEMPKEVADFIREFLTKQLC